MATSLGANHRHDGHEVCTLQHSLPFGRPQCPEPWHLDSIEMAALRLKDRPRVPNPSSSNGIHVKQGNLQTGLFKLHPFFRRLHRGQLGGGQLRKVGAD